MNNPTPAPTTALVKVRMPDCGNANRAARRACRKRGMCRGSGFVLKSVPTRVAAAS